jgi:hypothetical protein
VGLRLLLGRRAAAAAAGGGPLLLLPLRLLHQHLLSPGQLGAAARLLPLLLRQRRSRHQHQQQQEAVAGHLVVLLPSAAGAQVQQRPWTMRLPLLLLMLQLGQVGKAGRQLPKDAAQRPQLQLPMLMVPLQKQQ